MELTAGLALLLVSVATWAIATVVLIRDHPDARVPLWHRPLRLSRRAMLLRATAGACGVLGVAFLEHPAV
ncbi:hypothetical protein [Microbacterium sp. JZ31]|uniref:hypothetical protein n=1 Tax=Microbacterium sp. JZ31 TaxID=1906274 RepID=UPI00193143D2|nr:hypothetical protein [Microbacterium sp. JZ31]